MAIPAKYQGSCKDCGTTHAIGDMIDKNGKGSPNKMGEIMAHWCKNGKNCQGAQKFQGESKGIDFSKMARPVQGTAHPLGTSTGSDLPVSKDPTPEQFLELGKAMLTGEASDDTKINYINVLVARTNKRIAEELIKRSVIEKVMNDLGLQHPGRRGFIEDVLK